MNIGTKEGYFIHCRKAFPMPAFSDSQHTQGAWNTLVRPGGALKISSVSSDIFRGFSEASAVISAFCAKFVAAVVVKT